jgi:hypothetical protein
MFYDDGLGVPKDYLRAQKWYRKAAEGGLPESQYNLAAVILIPGNEVSIFGGLLPLPKPETPQEIDRYREALMWSIAAVKNGHPTASDGVRRISDSLPENEVRAAQNAAQKWIKPHIKSKCPALMWSSNPGAYEIQLQRRCNNPYFPASQQIVSEAELTEARKIDHEDHILAEQRLLQLAKETSGLTSVLTRKDFQYFRESLDKLIKFSIGVGGRTNEIASMANEMRDALISDMRRSFSNHKDLLALLEKTETSFKQTNRIFHTPVMAQMVRERSPIDPKHVIPTFLSEDAQTISLIMSIYDGQTRLELNREALKLLKKGLASGYIDPEYKEKLKIFSKEH